NVESTATLKLTHLGLALDQALAKRNVQRIARAAADNHNGFVEIDMEDSHYVDATLAAYRHLRDEGHRNVRIALQAYLYRTENDLRSLLDVGANVRIVKGAYLEPESVAYPSKSDVDRNYERLVQLALPEAEFTAIATHD